ncbi:G-protein coupled receptor 12 [Platysternon megacephalum]|uniref:G-protein coupled receptor 12 n=1 Tax=Platysternon megacephalum TaxID=55544 RepID=A0A4D9EJ21_9SAUR|nr:G-protein coupled receptor 12 [Platysternon megacephalum]
MRFPRALSGGFLVASLAGFANSALQGCPREESLPGQCEDSVSHIQLRNEEEEEGGFEAGKRYGQCEDSVSHIQLRNEEEEEGGFEAGKRYNCYEFPLPASFGNTEPDPSVPSTL